MNRRPAASRRSASPEGEAAAPRVLARVSLGQGRDMHQPGQIGQGTGQGGQCQGFMGATHDVNRSSSKAGDGVGWTPWSGKLVREQRAQGGEAARRSGGGPAGRPGNRRRSSGRPWCIEQCHAVEHESEAIEGETGSGTQWSGKPQHESKVEPHLSEPNYPASTRHPMGGARAPARRRSQRPCATGRKKER